MGSGDRVRLQLVHYVGVGKDPGTRHSYHVVHERLAERPAAGVRTGQMRCGTCGRLVGFTIHSRAGTRRRRLRLLAAALLAAAPLAGLIAVVLNLPEEGGPGWVTPTVSVAIAVLAVTAVSLLIMSPLEDGVVLDRARCNGPHAFRPPINSKPFDDRRASLLDDRFDTSVIFDE